MEIKPIIHSTIVHSSIVVHDKKNWLIQTSLTPPMLKSFSSYFLFCQTTENIIHDYEPLTVTRCALLVLVIVTSSRW